MQVGIIPSDGRKDPFPSWMSPSRFRRNPNYPHEFSRKAPEFAVPWPDFVPGANGENYKEFSALLPNRRGLKRADCSFWSKYIRSLKALAGRGPGAGGPGGGRAGSGSPHLLHTPQPLRHWDVVNADLSNKEVTVWATALCQGPPVRMGAGGESKRERTWGGGPEGLGTVE